MLGTPKEAALPNLKVYRAAWIAALVLAVITLFTLGTPDTPKLSSEPATFDGTRATADLRTFAQDFPSRVAGSDADSRSAIWLVQQFKAIGLQPHVDGFTAKVNGKDVALQNVWAISPGHSPGGIMLLASRDVAPPTTQGANDNASGVAALLELARVFTVTAHEHPLVFVCTTGDAFGAIGSRAFVEAHRTDGIIGAIAMRKVATAKSLSLGVNGWSTAPRTAPPWLWLLTAPAARVTANMRAILPGAPAQLIRLAVPATSGSQSPLVAAGVPAITVSADGPAQPAQNDTADTISGDTLTRVGDTVQAMVMAIDGSTGPLARSGGTIFLTRSRTLPGTSLALLCACLLLPLTAVTVDLYAHCRRTRVDLGPAIVRAALHLAPWLVLILIIYAANLVGLLPHSPDAAIPPDSLLVARPRYLRVVILLVLLVVASAYAVAVEHRLRRRVNCDPRATIFTSHAILLVIAAVTLLVDPFALVIVVPAAVLWPLAKPGGWMRSILPAYLGLVMIPLALLYYATQLGLGLKVWWYFFLLFENRSIPAIVALVSALFISTAAVLAHTLHERGLPPGALTWPAIERRRVGRPSEEEWAASQSVEEGRPRHRPWRRGRTTRRPRPGQTSS